MTSSRPRTGRWLSWLIVLIIATTTLAGLAAFKYRQIQAGIAFAASFPEASETVLVARVEQATYRKQETAIGEVVPLRSVDLIAELSGRITEVGFAPGAIVEAGQLLVALDTREERANLAAAEARAQLARLTVTRNESLSKQSLVSRQAADEARAEEQVALAEAAQLKAVIDKKMLRSPFDAMAGLHQWQVGDFVPAGTVVTRLVGVDDTLWVDFAVPQQQAAAALAPVVTIEHPGTGALLEGEIVAREPRVDADSRMLILRAKVPRDPSTALTPGTLVDVTLEVGPRRDALRVPATAVRRDAFGTHVFVLSPAEDGADAPLRAHRTAVDVAAIVGETAYLSSGVSIDTPVAADGAFKLEDGLLVHPEGNSEAIAAKPTGERR